MKYLSTDARVCLATIPSADEALQDLGTFAFIALHLLSAGGRNLSDVVELLRLIERPQELNTEAQGIISPPHLTTTLLYNVLRRWSLYLIMCVAASDSKDLESPVANAHFLI